MIENRYTMLNENIVSVYKWRYEKAENSMNTKPLTINTENIPDSKVHGANVGPTWGREDPGEPHVGHRKLAIWDHKYGVCILNDPFPIYTWTWT